MLGLRAGATILWADRPYRANVVLSETNLWGGIYESLPYSRANSKIDWDAFQTKDEAVAAAERLKRLEENYSIEERDGNCERCLSLIPNAQIAE